MTRYLAHALIDERGNIVGGAAGDQTGREVAVTVYADHRHGYDVAYRYMGADAEKVKNNLINGMVWACANDSIGYDQGGRTTSFYKVKKLGWKPKSLASVGACETDCSLLMGIVVNCALGKEVCADDTYTGNEAKRLEACGFKKVSFDASDGAGLQPADILIAYGHHTSMYIGTSKMGSLYSVKASGKGTSSTAAKKTTAKATASVSKFGGTYRCNVGALNVRKAPSMSGAIVAKYTKGQTVVLDNWYKIAEGYVWGRYTGATSGQKRYVAVGPYTGKAESSDYLVKVR